MEKIHDVAENTIRSLKAEKLVLAEQLKEDKHAPRIIIGKLMGEAEITMDEAHTLMSKAKEKEKEINDAKMAEEDRRKQALWVKRRLSEREKNQVGEVDCLYLRKYIVC